MHGKQWNASKLQLDEELQEKIASLSESQIAQAAPPGGSSIPTGLTRYWRTLPVYFKDSGAPKDLSSADNRLKWLTLARDETVAALRNAENRLLTAFLLAHPQTTGRWSNDPRQAARAIKDANYAADICPQEKGPLAP